MKKLTAVTTALALTLCLAPSYVFAADAQTRENGECEYPVTFVEELTFTNLAGYAFKTDDGNNVTTRAYADNWEIPIDSDGDSEPDGTQPMSTISIITPDEYGDERLTSYNYAFHVADIEYDGDELYVLSEAGTAYVYPSTAAVTGSELPFTQNYNLTDSATEYIYTLEHTTDGGRSLHAFNSGIRTTIFEDDCSHLKEYGGVIYVVNGNSIYALNKTEARSQTLEYINLELAENISTGGAAEALTADYTPRTVRIQPQTSDGHDTFITRIDLSSIGQTFVTMGTERLIGECPQALALCETGNATIVLIPEDGELNTYITLTTAIEETAYTAPENDMEGAYAREDLIIYSRPYICGSTAITEVERGTVFTVEEKFELSYIDDVFYKVSYTAGGQEITGYVAESLLSPYTFAAEDENPQSSGTDGFVYDNNVQTVIIVLLIVLLVLIAAGYVTFYLTRGGRKPRRRKTDSSDDEELYK